MNINCHPRSSRGSYQKFKLDSRRSLPRTLLRGGNDRAFTPLDKISFERFKLTKKNYLTGFTLLELLVVVAIISLLAGMIIVSLSSSRKKARDTRRKADLSQIALALEQYYDNQSPNSFVVADPEINITGTDALTTAISPNYIADVPLDPLSPNQQYHYQSLNIGADYRLEGVLENTADPQGEADGSLWVFVVENN